ncbi:MAG: hypothetical protein V3R98_13350 [Alphaproteobacteria bacterium]
MSELAGAWPWAALVGLGLFHGVNPAMGWLFAVALGLQEGRRGAVVRALAPIALGHAASILAVVAVVGAARAVVDLHLLRLAAGWLLVGFGAYRLVRGYRHKFRVGMQAGSADLALWSFLMATAHGAGLMVIPVLLEMPMGAAHAAAENPHVPVMVAFGDSLALALAAVGVHTAAMLATTGAIAVIVFDRVGLAVLRRGWVNLDLLWALALIAAGALLLALVGGWI